MVMDAPPPKEDVRPFIAIDEILRSIGLLAPKIYAADIERGLLLLEDFGDETFTRILGKDPDSERRLYETAVDTLIHLQQRFEPHQSIPVLDGPRLLEEVQLFTQWYLPDIAPMATNDEVLQSFIQVWRAALSDVGEWPVSLVLRDYHVDNLMIVEIGENETACGLLDFQDASVGSVLYDLVSLLQDARRDISPALEGAMIARYQRAFPALPVENFEAHYALLGVQRNVRILGVFTRLARRDGKTGYLQHMSRLWRLVETGLQHSALSRLQNWFEEYVPVQNRIALPVEPRP